MTVLDGLIAWAAIGAVVCIVLLLALDTANINIGRFGQPGTYTLLAVSGPAIWLAFLLFWLFLDKKHGRRW